ncbi:MAG: radical SAM protein [Opitutaceae bacterium]|nr:radical SAM protein [Cytophagales bacterium]
MLPEILLLIPPLTQLNTPYPATAYLKGFLNQQNIPSAQGDLGLDMVLKVFSKQGLKDVFNEAECSNFNISQELQSVLVNRKAYEETIDSVISFLQNNKYTLAYRIATRQYLPEGNRFNVIEDLEWFFGNNGIQDKARYLCTLYLEDLSDFIVATVGPHFGFSRYAERIARTAVSFDPIKEELEKPDNYLDQILVQCTQEYFSENIPLIVGFTVPFPGNLYGALKSSQWIKKNFPQTKIVLGGGYANTELRELKDPAVFNYVDYILLDDGEGPLLALYQHLTQPEKPVSLKRTYICQNGQVVYKNDLKTRDFNHSQLPAPNYEGLRLKDYLSVIDMPNPMHRLWSDGRWNKLTIAHGCYWKKCSFCDVSLDYISRYDPAPARSIVDRMEVLIAQTGETGFHFVDEAAPPLAMRDLAIEILRRGLQVTWWTNIRFEKTFTEDLCKLLAASGCIAVTGGLEVASDRLLNMMEKGVTIEQVARVCKGFRDTGILVHAYLMYGFPTQTEQETIDSLEIVRQLFQQNLLQSAFWHQFAMTVHSPVGINPEKYLVKRVGPEFKGFANNDLYHEDPTGTYHEKYSDGLKKALYNYMHGVGLDFPLSTFFDFKVRNTLIPSNLIFNFFKSPDFDLAEMNQYRLMWFQVKVSYYKKNNKGTDLLFVSRNSSAIINMPSPIAEFWISHANRLEITSTEHLNYGTTIVHFSELCQVNAKQILKQEWWRKIKNEFLWVIK